MDKILKLSLRNGQESVFKSKFKALIKVSNIYVQVLIVFGRIIKRFFQQEAALFFEEKSIKTHQKHPHYFYGKESLTHQAVHS